MSGLCKFKDSLGEPGKGVHSIRIFNIAVIDVLLTILLGFFIHKKFFPTKNIYVVILSMFVLGIIFHRLFCVKTTVDKILFGS